MQYKITARSGMQLPRWFHFALKISVSRWKSLEPSIDCANGRAGQWEDDEVMTLKNAVQKYGGMDWSAIAELVPGRTKMQCYRRWHNSAFDPSIDWASGYTGKWLEAQGGKNWDAVASLVPGRTKKQCWGRWHNALDPSRDWANGRTGKLAEDEDSKVKNAVQEHAGEDWIVIVSLVPGRIEISVERDGKVPWIPASTEPIDVHGGKWRKDEDIKLKNAVQKHGGEDWVAIAALVPGRTFIQCRSRWRKHWISQHRPDNWTVG